MARLTGGHKGHQILESSKRILVECEHHLLPKKLHPQSRGVRRRSINPSSVAGCPMSSGAATKREAIRFGVSLIQCSARRAEPEGGRHMATVYKRGNTWWVRYSRGGR